MDFDLLSHITSVVVAHQQGPGRVSSEAALLKLIGDVGGVLSGCKPGASEAASVAASPVTIRGPRHKVAAPTPKMLECLECGMQLKMLKRHLLTVHGMTPEGYCKRNNLSASAPMVTSDYAELRSELAKASGLGKRPRTTRTS